MTNLFIKKNKRLNLNVLFFIFLFIYQLVNLSAQDEIPDSLINERIQCIQNMLYQEKTNANLWWYGWLTGYSATVLVQGTLYFLSNDIGVRQDMVLGTSTAMLGVIGQLIMPLYPGYKAEILSNMPVSTAEERLKKLYNAEEMLKAIAIKEKNGKTWQIHVLYSAFNLSSGLITWLGFKRSVWDGVGNFALNTIVSEIQIWTQPTQSVKDYQSYCRKYKSGIPPIVYKSKPTYYVSAYQGGIRIKVLF